MHKYMWISDISNYGVQFVVPFLADFPKRFGCKYSVKAVLYAYIQFCTFAIDLKYSDYGTR